MWILQANCLLKNESINQIVSGCTELVQLDIYDLSFGLRGQTKTLKTVFSPHFLHLKVRQIPRCASYFQFFSFSGNVMKRYVDLVLHILHDRKWELNTRTALCGIILKGLKLSCINTTALLRNSRISIANYFFVCWGFFFFFLDDKKIIRAETKRTWTNPPDQTCPAWLAWSNHSPKRTPQPSAETRQQKFSRVTPKTDRARCVNFPRSPPQLSCINTVSTYNSRYNNFMVSDNQHCNYSDMQFTCNIITSLSNISARHLTFK